MTIFRTLLMTGAFVLLGCTTPAVDDRASAACGAERAICAEGMFCELPAGSCDADDTEGACAAMPEICTMEYAPVCGCDGETYGNDCQRRGAGVSVLYAGECRQEST